MLDACSNPPCGKIATVTLEVVNYSGEVVETHRACAYCADEVSVDDGYEVRRA